VSYSFPKSVRLRRRREFEKIGRQGSRLIGNKIVIELLSTSDDKVRLGITVTKKYGKAHDRNRFKRCVREAFRLSLPRLPKGLLLNIRPRLKSVNPTLSAVTEELLRLLKCSK